LPRPVGELLRARVIIAVVVVVLAVAATGAAVAMRLRRRPTAAPGWRANHIRATTLPPAARPTESPLSPQPPAVEAPREVHLHLHGVSGKDLAAILAMQREE
jgi:hypothetical protein